MKINLESLELLDKGLSNDKRTYSDSDSKAKTEDEKLNKDIREAANVARIISNTGLRTESTYAFISIIVMWLLLVIIILMGNNSIFKISDNVLITLLTTTTLNVFGMMIIILKGLFTNSEDNEHNNG
jgi:hypothetical protein